jgi:membrane protease subunit HflC
MQQFKIVIYLIAFFFALLVFSGSVYIVNEIEQVVITQFGNPVGDPITEPGVHFKLPIIQKINVFDKRFLEWDGDPNEVPTKDKTYIFVDSYARWRIIDPLLFFQKVQNEKRAQSRLDDILDGAARVMISKYELVELVRLTNREFENEEDKNLKVKKIKKGRSVIVEEIIKNSQPKTKDLGIEILDFQFKRIKYAESVQREIFNRMITERKKIAEKFRSEGQGLAAEILGQKERDLKEIRSNGFRQAEVIRGEADAEATKIYANAYDKNADTRDFYKFLKTMETYKQTLTQKDIMILSTKSDFFRYLNKQK